MCEHNCVLGVPINEKGVQLVEMTYDLYTPDLEDNLRWFQFSLEEIDKVYDLIDEFNQTFGMLIDNYEECVEIINATDFSRYDPVDYIPVQLISTLGRAQA